MTYDFHADANQVWIDDLTRFSETTPQILQNPLVFAKQMS